MNAVLRRNNNQVIYLACMSVSKDDKSGGFFSYSEKGMNKPITVK